MVQLYVKKDNELKAIELANETFPEYLNVLPGYVLLKLGVYYGRIIDYKKARPCFELAMYIDGLWQAKAMLLLSKDYLEMNVPERAATLLQEIIDKYRSGIFREQAKSVISKMF